MSVSVTSHLSICSLVRGTIVQCYAKRDVDSNELILRIIVLNKFLSLIFIDLVLFNHAIQLNEGPLILNIRPSTKRISLKTFLKMFHLKMAYARSLASHLESFQGGKSIDVFIVQPYSR